MPRPFCCRRIGFQPGYSYFKPRGIPTDELSENILTLDELEAVRLADLNGMYQEQAAKCMNVSRPTFGRIIDSAHQKIADVLVNGKVLKIETGKTEFTDTKWYKCQECDTEIEIPQQGPNLTHCPKCGNRYRRGFGHCHRKRGGNNE